MNSSQRSPLRLLGYGSALAALVWVAGLGLAPAAGSGEVTHPEDWSGAEHFTAALGAKGDAGGDYWAVKGWKDCLRCHNSGAPGGKIEVAGVLVDLDAEQWVTYREFPIWAKEDKHNQAFAVLLNDRSKKMGRILKTDVHLDKRCLGCHTGFPIDLMKADDNDTTGVMISPANLKNIEITFGVTCEGCHGPAEVTESGIKKGVKGWFGPHQESGTWRFLAPDTKEEKFGFWDVRSPASKTKICASCHIGSVEHGRVLTHEMYAAGHPPLPAFEVETFINQMPPHWAPFQKKAADAVAVFLKNTKDPLYRAGAYKKENLHQSRALLVGALVSAGEYFDLIGDLCEVKSSSPLKGSGWPELAAFDCYACHHELKGPSWRQVRKPPAGIPGRPFLQEWNTTLLKVALKQLDDAPEKFKPKFDAVRDALNKQAFGSRFDLKKSSKEAAAWLHARADELQRKPLTPLKGPEVMRDLVNLAATGYHDYDSARQFVWSIEVVDAESKQLGVKKKAEQILNPPGKEMFLLDMRAGRKASASIPGDPQVRPLIEVDLATVMPYFANYDPLRFQQGAFAIRKLLK